MTDRPSRPTRSIQVPIIGGVVFAVVSTLLGLLTRDQQLSTEVISGITGGIVFALVWILIIRWRGGR